MAAAWIVGFGLTSARIARTVDRRAIAWFAIGAIIGPVAPLLLRAGPPGRCRACGTPTRWRRICWWCHQDVRSSPAATQAIVARMSQRIAGTAQAVEPGREPAGSVEAPRPFIIRSEPVRATPFTLTESSPRAKSGTRRESIRSAEAPVRGATLRGDEAGGAANADAAAAVAKATTARGEPFVPAGYHAGTQSPADSDGALDDQRLLATAVFVAGSARLEPGHRYSLALRPGRFLVLGPIDVAPTTVVLDRAIAEMEVRSLDGRLILSEPNSGSGLVLAFMSVAGTSTENLASTIADASRAASSV